MMLNKLINQYEKYLVNSEKRDYNKTVRKYVKNIKECFEYMNIETLDDIKNLTYIGLREEWLCVKRDEGLSSQSLNLRIVSVKSFLNYLKGLKLIDENVAKDVKRFEIKQKQKVVNTDNVMKMLELAKQDYNNKPCFLTIRNYFILNFTLATGLRNSEMREIKIDDINFSNGKFTVIGKYSKYRNIKLNKSLMDLYRNYLYYRNQLNTNEKYLLVSKNGRKLDSNNLKEVFKKYSKLAGIKENITPHSFRHKFATTMIENGHSLEEVAKAMGHTNIQILYQWYYHPEVDGEDNLFDDNPIFDNSAKNTSNELLEKYN